MPRQRRAFVIAGCLLGVATVILLTAWRTTGFLSDLLLNVGSSVVLAAISYLIFDPLFEEARRARVQEHLSFDQQAFVSHLRRSRRHIRILDTWTILLEDRHRQATLDAVTAALRGGAVVQVLLLDPDCRAAHQRSEELEQQGVNVPAQIRTNLRHLSAFHAKLPVEERHRFQVRIYDASPSIQLYQWDDRGLISFFPVGKLSFNVSQLEVDMDSPWGAFVHARFEELWKHDQATVPLAQYWTITVVLRFQDADVAEIQAPYVVADGEHYVDCGKVRPGLPLTARVRLSRRTHQSTPQAFTLVEPADGDRATVARHFGEKYGRADGDRTILRLVPARLLRQSGSTR
ncbi:hypothetical protein E1091_06295 [Micromonospora fluostatini]|uniref:Uncharacterized protein n=1 Tax=Micromonospora fluostatini TaxID=1629071 RepID=A0ABY2DIW5_9ACTN|nr:hypothetical protein E1091_06295 [Micromonospora fluostatini]